jgi:hypothetical protein
MLTVSGVHHVQFVSILTSFWISSLSVSNFPMSLTGRLHVLSLTQKFLLLRHERFQLSSRYLQHPGHAQVQHLVEVLAPELKRNASENLNFLLDKFDKGYLHAKPF